MSSFIDTIVSTSKTGICGWYSAETYLKNMDNLMNSKKNYIDPMDDNLKSRITDALIYFREYMKNNGLLSIKYNVRSWQSAYYGKLVFDSLPMNGLKMGFEPARPRLTLDNDANASIIINDDYDEQNYIILFQ